MGIATTFLSLLFLILLAKFPRAVIWASFIIFILACVASIAFSLFYGQWIGAIISAAFFGLFICFLIAFRDKINAAIVLIKLTTQFLFNNLTVFVVSFITATLSIIITSMICAGVIGISFLTTKHSIPKELASGFYGFSTYPLHFLCIVSILRHGLPHSLCSG